SEPGPAPVRSGKSRSAWAYYRPCPGLFCPSGARQRHPPRQLIGAGRSGHWMQAIAGGSRPKRPVRELSGGSAALVHDLLLAALATAHHLLLLHPGGVDRLQGVGLDAVALDLG